jgi:Tn3 transposase DDE domain
MAVIAPGKSASADGTKWELYPQNLMSEYHIRYGGYGGIGYYLVADSYIALGGTPRAKLRRGGGRLCRIRVTLDRAARRGLFPRGERPALGTVDSPRQDRRALRKPGFPTDPPKSVT